eukprot:2061609-Lingulodinium_polyedra.AAC.1
MFAERAPAAGPSAQPAPARSAHKNSDQLPWVRKHRNAAPAQPHPAARRRRRPVSYTHLRAHET